MSKSAKSILQGAKEALAYAKKEKTGPKIHKISIPHAVFSLHSHDLENLTGGKIVAIK